MIDCGLRRRELLAQARQMAAGDVAGFVREHADDLVRRLRVHQRAGIDEDAPAVRHEGVERAVVDDDDLDVLLREAGGAQDRLGVVAQQLLDLGVADDRRAAAARAGPAPGATATWLATSAMRPRSRSPARRRLASRSLRPGRGHASPDVPGFRAGCADVRLYLRGALPITRGRHAHLRPLRRSGKLIPRSRPAWQCGTKPPNAATAGRLARSVTDG